MVGFGTDATPDYLSNPAALFSNVDVQLSGDAGIHLLDAPITGGAAGAEAATLTYMVGGASEVVERCRAVFLMSGQKVIHAGPVGTGILLKLCNNLMTYAAFTAADEAGRLAGAGGLDRRLQAVCDQAAETVRRQYQKVRLADLAGKG